MTGSRLASASLIEPGPGLPTKKSAKSMKAGTSRVNPTTNMGIRFFMARNSAATDSFLPQSRMS
jgi:hypothetical protein